MPSNIQTNSSSKDKGITSKELVADRSPVGGELTAKSLKGISFKRDGSDLNFGKALKNFDLVDEIPSISSQ